MRRGGGFWDELVKADETDRDEPDLELDWDELVEADETDRDEPDLESECEDVSVAPPQTSEGFCDAVLVAHRTEFAAREGVDVDSFFLLPLDIMRRTSAG